MIFRFFSVSAVSLAMLSWSMIGSQDLMGMQAVSRGQLEIVSREGSEEVVGYYPLLRNFTDLTLTLTSYVTRLPFLSHPPSLPLPLPGSTSPGSLRRGSLRWCD